MRRALPSVMSNPIETLKEDLALAYVTEHQAADPTTNTVDATRGMPLIERARLRRIELVAARDLLAEDDVRGRSDLEIAIAGVDGLLTGDPTHLDSATAFELNRWLEANKHLALEVPVRS